jgi:hypothetical protein
MPCESAFARAGNLTRTFPKLYRVGHRAALEHAYRGGHEAFPHLGALLVVSGFLSRV